MSKHVLLSTLFILLNAVTYAQEDSLALVMNLIIRTSEMQPITYEEMAIIIKSNDNKAWENNVELGESRMEAINSILFSSHNLNLLFKFLKNNPRYIEYALEDIMPSYELGDSVYFYVNKQKGYDQIKSKILDRLRDGYETYTHTKKNSSK